MAIPAWLIVEAIGDLAGLIDYGMGAFGVSNENTIRQWLDAIDNIGIANAAAEAAFPSYTTTQQSLAPQLVGGAASIVPFMTPAPALQRVAAIGAPLAGAGFSAMAGGGGGTGTTAEPVPPPEPRVRPEDVRVNAGGQDVNAFPAPERLAAVEIADALRNVLLQEPEIYNMALRAWQEDAARRRALQRAAWLQQQEEANRTFQNTAQMLRESLAPFVGR